MDARIVQLSKAIQTVLAAAVAAETFETPFRVSRESLPRDEREGELDQPLVQIVVTGNEPSRHTRGEWKYKITTDLGLTKRLAGGVPEVAAVDPLHRLAEQLLEFTGYESLVEGAAQLESREAEMVDAEALAAGKFLSIVRLVHIWKA